MPVPPPRDWSELTGNIPVITAPLLEEPVRVAAGAPVAPPAPTQAPPPAPPRAPVNVPAQAAPVAAEAVPVAAEAVTLPAALPVVPPLAVAAVEAPLAQTVDAPSGAGAAVPGWRAPDDPTLRVFADTLVERERRRSAPRPPSRRRRRRLLRLLVWLVGIGLITAALVLAQARLPFSV